MSNGRFSLFPGAPSAHNLFSKRAIQYQWRSNGPVFTSAIIIACVAVWVVEMVFSLFWPLGLATMIYYGRFDPLTAVAQPSANAPSSSPAPAPRSTTPAC